MVKILVVFATSLGATRRMASAVADGARSVDGMDVRLLTAADAGPDDALWADALILGSPMRHRSADARVKDFIERVLEQLWLTDELVDKVGGVFTVDGGFGDAGAGCDIAQIGMLAAMAACGMIMVPFPKCSPGAAVAGSHWGPSGRSGGPMMEPVGITEEMLLAGRSHGVNVATVARALAGKRLLLRGVQAPTADVLAQFKAGGDNPR